MGTKINVPPKKETLETPKNFFCFINNMRMTTLDCLECAKNPHVHEILKSGVPAPPPSIAFKIFKRYRQRKTQSNPIKQNL